MQSTSRPASTSTRPAVSPLPRQVNTQTKVLDSVHGRILCIADIRGRLSALNDLAREANAKAIIHTGDFGFFEANSLDRINDRTLRHLTMYSPLIPSAQRNHLVNENDPAAIRSTVNISLLSEFPLLLSGQIKLQVPVYTVWGACEDVLVLEKFRLGNYSIDNLHVLDEATTRCLDLGGVKLRLLGLGGAHVPHKMFDNGDGNATIAGGQGTMWTTALQIGELVDTAQRVFDASETRLFVSHTSPGREGIIAQLALVLKADLTISAGLHFRYATSYNEFSVQSDFEGFRHKLTLGKESFDRVWDSVKTQVDAVIDEHQRVLLNKALNVVERIPPAQPSGGPGATATGEEPAWKNCWNWNLCDAAYGSLILDVKEGRISAELKSQGFNYAYRRTATAMATPSSATSALPPSQLSINATMPPSKGTTPIPTNNNHNTGPADTPEKTSTPPPGSTSIGGSPATGSRVNGTPNSERAEKEKAKKKEKREKRDKERQDRDRASLGGASTPDTSGARTTPIPPSSSSQSQNLAESTSVSTLKSSEGGVGTDEIKSPIEGSSGLRTPKTGKPPRNPWTIFMKTQANPTDPELREFFGEAKNGITKITIPPTMAGRPRIAYIEFGDEEAMKAGLEKHAEKFKDTTAEVKQSIDRENRDTQHHRGGPRGGGRGGRGGSGFASRGLAAAGLTRGSTRGGGVNHSNNPNQGGEGGGAAASAGDA